MSISYYCEKTDTHHGFVSVNQLYNYLLNVYHWNVPKARQVLQDFADAEDRAGDSATHIAVVEYLDSDYYTQNAQEAQEFTELLDKAQHAVKAAQYDVNRKNRAQANALCKQAIAVVTAKNVTQDHIVEAKQLLADATRLAGRAYIVE